MIEFADSFEQHADFNSRLISFCYNNNTLIEPRAAESGARATRAQIKSRFASGRAQQHKQASWMRRKVYLRIMR